jgi:hypothetical protein
MPRKKLAPSPAEQPSSFYSPEGGTDAAKVRAANPADPQPVPNTMRGTETAGKPPRAPRRQVAPEPQASALPRHEALHVDSDRDDLSADAAFLEAQSERKALAADIERIRKLREARPFSTMTQKLALPTRPGYYRHWFNDEPGRVDEATNNGWSHVKDKDSKPVKLVVGTGRDKGALNAYAMEMPIVFWNEDRDRRHKMAQDRVDEIKKAPFRAKPGQADKSDQGKFYSARDEPLRIDQPNRPV